MEDFWPRWRHRQINYDSSHNQKKDNKFKNKKPELPENGTVWKSNIQGVKEETFIQTGRRGGNRQWGWRMQGKAAAGGLGMVPHLHVAKLVACG